jgi:hypothetical protein
MINPEPLPYASNSGLKNISFSDVVSRTMLLALLWLAACWAGNAQAAQALSGAPKSFALVFRVEGELTATGADVRRVLRVGDTVAVGERITAGPAAEGVLKMHDGGYIAVRPGAEFMAKQFVADGKPTDTSLIELFKGGLRIISGWIGKINRQGSRVSTTTATIGIRGTDHEPFVLLNDDEDATRFKPGTYDKVNQGGTTLEAAGQSIDIDPGKVGFASSPGKSRALMTLLFPVLLEKVPAFYVPGKFDAEMDELSKGAQGNNQRQLDAKRKQLASCIPNDVAKRWVKDLDQHIVRGDAESILVMFAKDVQIKATVRGADGKMTELELQRGEFADSIVAAVSSLRDYKHRRITIEGRPLRVSESGCAPIAVKSIVIEEGRQAGKPYRFESEEKYLLEQVDGIWLAVQAETRQR